VQSRMEQYMDGRARARAQGSHVRTEKNRPLRAEPSAVRRENGRGLIMGSTTVVPHA
jgi:hypothetical protein